MIQLCSRPISRREIDEASKGIDESKAPGLDGFNSYFFKHVWDWVNEKRTYMLQYWSSLTLLLCIGRLVACSLSPLR